MKLFVMFFLCWAACRAEAPVSVPPVELTELKAYLGLSDRQATQLQQVYQARSLTVRQLWNEISEKQQELNELLNSAAPDPLLVGHLMIAVQDARRQIGDKSSHDAALNVLSDPQKRKLADLETALALRPALDQAVISGLIEQRPHGAMIPPLTVAQPSSKR